MGPMQRVEGLPLSLPTNWAYRFCLIRVQLSTSNGHDSEPSLLPWESALIYHHRMPTWDWRVVKTAG